jgi:hypothetical protein
MRRPIVTTTIVTTMLGAGLDQRPTGNARVLFWVRGAAEEGRAPRPRWLDAPAADIDAALNVEVEDWWRRSRSSSSGSSTWATRCRARCATNWSRSSSAWAGDPGPRRAGPVRLIAHGGFEEVCPMFRHARARAGIEVVPRREVSYWCVNGHHTVRGCPPPRQLPNYGSVGTAACRPARTTPIPRADDQPAGQEPASPPAGTTLRGRMRSVVGRSPAEPPSSPPRPGPPRAPAGTAIMTTRPGIPARP